MIILNDGRGAFADFPKYREMMTDYFWRGKVPDQKPEDKAAAVKESIGKPIPETALDEARRLREQLNANRVAEGS